MNWLQSILYGLLSGLAEFLPISSSAHRMILQKIYGLEGQDPICELLVHLGVLLAILTCCSAMLHSLRRDSQQRQTLRTGKRRTPRGVYDIRLLRTAAAPLLIGLLLLWVTASLGQNLIFVSLFLLVNGILLFLPERMSTGNKDARSMSRLDGFLIGLSGVLSVFPGISRVGATLSAASARGADRHNALSWSLLLSIPALVVLMGFDVLNLATQGIDAFVVQRLIEYILTFITAYGGGYLSILIMRFLAVRSGFSGFAYYCWGASLFTFILYMAI